MMRHTVEFLKPFAVGALLALLGGWIGLFCTLVVDNVWRGVIGVELLTAIMISFVPVFILLAARFALYGTLLLPIAYYLTRRIWPVTPVRYAILGTGLAAAVVVCFYVWQHLSTGLPTREVLHRMSAGGIFGTVLAGAICGSLFGRLVRGHYERYRVSRPGRA